MDDSDIPPAPQDRVVTSRPWNPVFLSATAAVVVPMTAAVHGVFEKNRDVEVQGQRLQQELTLQRERYVHELRLAYLDKMRDPTQQGRILRLVATTTEDAALRAWAEDELRRLDVDPSARTSDEAQRAAKTAKAR